MFKKVVFAAFLLLPLFSFSQETIKQYVVENQKSIRSIEPTDTDYSDLEAFGNAIGDKQIVMLGEQDHGDAPTFLAKTRLIKYLHEKKGFNVLAFESDFFGLTEGWDKLTKDSASAVKFATQNIFAMWTNCDACYYLFKTYIPQTQNTSAPLNLSGFDNQLVQGYSLKHLFKDLDTVMRTKNFPITKLDNYKKDILPTISKLPGCYYVPQKNDSLLNIIYSYLTQIKSEAIQILKPTDYWYMVIDNAVANALQLKTMVAMNNGPRRNYKSSDVRDKQMAANLKWLSEVKYPNEKIIVWAHNVHVSKNAPALAIKYWGKTMGSFMAEDPALAAKTYILGFTSYEGTAGRLGAMGNNKYKVQKVKNNSFENWIDIKDSFAFVDFKKFNASNTKPPSFFMKGYEHHYLKQEPWTSIFDGVFYVRNMYNCQVRK